MGFKIRKANLEDVDAIKEFFAFHSQYNSEIVKRFPWHVETMLEQGDLAQLLDTLGITKEQFKKKFIVPESFSGTFDIALSV